MLRYLELHNFKSHHSTRLQFDQSRLHALVGANSSGKTSILRAIYYLSQLTDKAFDDVFSNDSAPKFIVNNEAKELFVKGAGFLGA